MNENIYAVVINKENAWGIDAEIELYRKKSKAKERINELYKQALQRTNLKEECVNIIKSFYKNNEQAYSLGNMMGEAYLTELKFNDPETSSGFLPKSIEMLFELSNQNTQAQVQINKAIIAHKGFNKEETKKAIEDYITSLQLCITQAASVIDHIDSETGTVWVTVNEWHDQEEIKIQLYHSRNAAKEALEEMFTYELKTKRTDLLIQESRNIWQKFKSDNYEKFEIEYSTGKDYGRIVKLMIN